MWTRAVFKSKSALVALPTTTARSTNVLSKRMMGGGGGPAPPAFVRLPPPNKPLPEEYELLWHDGVAPEMAVDFDSPHVSTLTALRLWLTALGSVGLITMYYAYVYDVEAKRPAKKRELDVHEALGSYQNSRTPARFRE